MAYKVFFTDSTLHPEPLEVQDNFANTDTSIAIPGRNQTGYGRIVAENFLHLLENFASGTKPSVAKSVIGQLWFNSDENKLYVFDGIDYKTTSNISTGVNEPTGVSLGDLWVNSSTQQLYLWSGTNWVLIGPQFSGGTKSGPLVETILDIDNNSRTVIIFYNSDIPVVIISKDDFIPKIVIQGFASIGAGINITTRTDISQEIVNPKLLGVARAAESLVVGLDEIPSSSFIRSDTIGTIQAQLNIRDDAGIFLGTNGNINLGVRSSSGILYNSTPGASLDLQTTRTGAAGLPSTVVRIVEDKVGILNNNPQEPLDVGGNIKLAGNIISTSEQQSSNLSNGALITAGGAAIAKNVNIGGDLSVLNGNIFSKSIKPLTASETIGDAANRYSTIYAGTIDASVIKGNLSGNIAGNALTATSLQAVTNFKLEGDISSNVVSFNGTGNLTKTFVTTLTSDIISNKSGLGNSSDQDEILVYRNSLGLRKMTRETFIDDAGVPIGAVLPYAGATAPIGYLLCDGSEYEAYRFRDLYDVIGTNTNYKNFGLSTSVNLKGSDKGDTFRVPDLRGRTVVGNQSMNADTTVPYPGGTSSPDAGIPLSELGGNRISDTATANVLGRAGGAEQYSLQKVNVPDHDHDMSGRTSANSASSIQYYAITETPTTNLDYAPGGAIRNIRIDGGTVANGAQAMPSSGLVRVSDERYRTPGRTDSEVGKPFTVMNPYITLNYIIRSGRPRND